MRFTVERMFRLPDAGGLKAFADVSIDDTIVIRGVRVLGGKKGLFVSMPQEQGKDNKWYDQVVCKSADVYEQLSECVIKHYNDGVQTTSECVPVPEKKATSPWTNSIQ